MDAKLIVAIIAAAFGLFGGTIALINFLTTWKRNQKALTYRTITDTLLVNRHGDAPGKVKILYDGQAVENVRLIEVELRNSGAQPITDKDFYERVTISLGEGKIFETEIQRVNPPDLKVKLNYTEVHTGLTNGDRLFEMQNVTLEPLLLNAGNVIVIKLLTDAPKTCKARVSGRIVGVEIRNIEVSDNVARSYELATVDMIAILGALAIATTLYLIPNNTHPAISIIILLVSIVVLGRFAAFAADSVRKRLTGK
jgi:hypothetical protein